MKMATLKRFNGNIKVASNPVWGRMFLPFSFTKRNNCQSSNDHPIFLLCYLQEHFLKEAIVIDFQIKYIRIYISEILEARNFSELCEYIPDCGDEDQE